MTSVAQFSPVYRKKEQKRRKMMYLKTAMRWTNSLIKEFREMKLVDIDDTCLPPKKRKLTENSTNGETTDVDSITDSVMLDLTLESPDVKEKVDTQDIPLKEWPYLRITESSKNMYNKRFNLFKKSPKIRNKFNSRKNLITREVQKVITLQQLFKLFQNSVNFVQPRGYTAIEDIDLVVRYFGAYGQVMNIQDHWIKPRGSLIQYPSVWAGALVTYRNVDDCRRAWKSISVAPTSMICISISDHLSRINGVESKWASQFNDSKIHGTSIVVEGIGCRTPRKKLREEFAMYGTILEVRWGDLTQLKNICEVTYKSTVNAVAAALALDGKNVHRCHLRTKIKVTEKELFIHRSLRESF